jgi:rhamnogalacturonan endolyase
MRCLTTAALLLFSTASAFLNATEDDKSLTIANERLVASVSKSRGYVNKLFLDGQNLLGTENGNTGLL